MAVYVSFSYDKLLWTLLKHREVLHAVTLNQIWTNKWNALYKGRMMTDDVLIVYWIFAKSCCIQRQAWQKLKLYILKMEYRRTQK